MSQRYKVRAFESGDQDGIVAEGTIVLPIERSFSVFSRSLGDAELRVKSEVAEGKLASGRVYQICPPFGSSESIRTFVVTREGQWSRAFLDPASGIYSEFRRIRYEDLRRNPQRECVNEVSDILQEA